MPNDFITINNTKFYPNEACEYRNNYVKIVTDLKKASADKKRSVFRELALSDLFFIFYFILRIPIGNVPFIVDRCKEVEEGPISNTLDIWARFHGKSSIITIAETVQYHLKYPEKCTCIFSYKKAAAERFVSAIRQAYESEWLIKLFPDRLYKNPSRDSVSWSLANGITLRRPDVARPQRTVQASGLIDGMLQGDHFERRIYDDIETDDMKDSQDQLDKCYEKFAMSINLGTDSDNDIERVIGTYYSHLGPLIRIRDHMKFDGSQAYHYRHYPATDDGTIDGTPVFISQDKLDQLKMLPTFYSQQLCDPTPKHDMTLDPQLLQKINADEIPKYIYKFLVIDPAGGISSRRSDAWAVHVIGANPVMDDMGASDIYILDSFIDKTNESEIVYILSNMHMRNGLISAVGYECINRTTPGWVNHFQNAMKARGVIISEEAKNLMMINPQGREKKSRITSALRLPLLHGKIHISDRVPEKYYEQLKTEMMQHPVGNDNGIDALAMVYNMMDEFGFMWRIQSKKPSPPPIAYNSRPNSWLSI
jgi:hypothetical protein